MTDDLRDVDDVRAEPDEIDAAWMTAALEQAGVARGARVTEVHVQGFIGTGQTGRNARLALQWDDPDGRPATVVGKFASADPNARLAAFTNGTYQNEWAFYHHLAHTLHIRTPQCHVARFDGSVPSFVLIMEDIAGSRQGDQIAGQRVDVVGGDVRRARRAAVSPLIGRQHAVAGGGQRGDLVPPGVGQFGEAVHQHHRGTVRRSRTGHGQPDAVRCVDVDHFRHRSTEAQRFIECGNCRSLR